MRNDPRCPYCGASAKLLTAEQKDDYVYDTDYGPIWACLPCSAWVGCHKGTINPVGRLADSELRAAKRQAHRVFDRLWLGAESAYPELRSLMLVARLARKRAYHWLAEQMGLSLEDCHIGKFDLTQCRQVIEIIKTQQATPASIRDWAKERGQLPERES